MSTSARNFTTFALILGLLCAVLFGFGLGSYVFPSYTYIRLCQDADYDGYISRDGTLYCYVVLSNGNTVYEPLTISPFVSPGQK